MLLVPPETVGSKAIKGKTTLDGEVKTKGNLDVGGVLGFTALHIKGNGVSTLSTLSQMMWETQNGLRLLGAHKHSANTSTVVNGGPPSVSIGAPDNRNERIGALKGELIGWSSGGEWANI